MRRGSRASFPIFTSLENVTRSKGSRAISAFFAAALSSLFVAAQCFASSKVDSVDLCQEALICTANCSTAVCSPVNIRSRAVPELLLPASSGVSPAGTLLVGGWLTRGGGVG